MADDPLAAGRRAARRRAALLAAAGVALGACDMASREAPPCRPEVPTSARLLAAPSFARLSHYKRVMFDVRRGFGYDLWADSRFEYGAALEFTLVRTAAARNDDELCANAVSLKLAMPATPARREMLREFVARADLGAAGAPHIVARLEEIMAKGGKYQPVASDATRRIEAGIVAHRSRGDLFVVTYTWPS